VAIQDAAVMEIHVAGAAAAAGGGPLDKFMPSRSEKMRSSLPRVE
jgi:hypothetical protein